MKTIWLWSAANVYGDLHSQMSSFWTVIKPRAFLLPLLIMAAAGLGECVCGVSIISPAGSSTSATEHADGLSDIVALEASTDLHKDAGLHVQAVFNSCRTLDLRNATVSLGCVDLLRGAASLECLRLRSDYFTADTDGSKHEELTKFIALLPVSLPTRQSCDQFLRTMGGWCSTPGKISCMPFG